MEKKMRVCDVYGTTKDVEQYHVTLARIDGGGDVPGITQELDLSPRALKRLKAFIDRGTKPTKANA